MRTLLLVTVLSLITISSIYPDALFAEPQPVDSGIELTGQAKDSPPPKYWYVYDAKDYGTNESPKYLTYVENAWGTTPLPPGEYVITIQPGALGVSEINWAKVKVEKGKTTTVKLDSGIELVGQAKDSPPPKYWSIYDAKDYVTNESPKYLTYVEDTWGITPLPPGEYVITIQPGASGGAEIRWTTVKVERGKTTTVKVDSGIELVGSAKDGVPPKIWYIYDAKEYGTNDNPKYLTYVERSWGVTPLPPGEYVVTLHPGALGGYPIRWATVKVEISKTTTVKVDSEIELIGSAKDSLPPKIWYVYDAKEYATNDNPKYLTYVEETWGTTPLPSGEYVITMQPGALGSSEIRWATVKIEISKTTTVKVDSGIELVGQAKDSPPPKYWYVYDAKDYGTKDNPKYLTYVENAWGTTQLPPGDYVITIQPSVLGSSKIRWETVKVERGKTTAVKVDSGIELVGRAKNSPPPKRWYIYDAKAYATNENPSYLTFVEDNWGASPLQPGDYVIVIEPNEKSVDIIRWAKAHVSSGEFITINAEPTLEERLALVTGKGRKLEKEIDAEGYKKLEEEIERAIRRGAAWLKTQPTLDLEDLRSGYPTIGILALVHSGEFERDPGLASRCVDHLMRRRLDGSFGVYSTALTAMALRDIDPYHHRNRIFECAQWLVENQGWGREAHKVWGYGDAVPGIGEEKKLEIGQKGFREKQPSIRDHNAARLEVARKGLVANPRSDWDNSNTQFAVLGLHSSAHSGIGIPRECWQRVNQHFLEMQCSDGGWAYHGPGSSYGSMTCSGLASLVMARHHLGEKRAMLDPAVISGLEWLDWHFTVEKNPWEKSNHYYYLYGLERAGIMAGTEFFGEHEWYPVGARYLLANQKGNGSWTSAGGAPTGGDGDYLDTCYAILFLRRATLPLEPAKPAFLAVTAEKVKLPPALMPAVEVILDSSGSMKELVGKQPKIKIAQSVMADVLDHLPDTIQLGLRLYGHRNGNEAKPPASALDAAAKTNTRLVLPIAPLTKERREKIKEWVNWAAPWGWTPMVYSVLQAKNDFPTDGSASKTVVLISDGAETCGGKIEDIGKAYRDSGIDVVIHVVGFDVEKDPVAKKQLMDIATLGGGKYFSASDAQGLSTALDQALQGIEFVVTDPSTGKQVSHGAVNDEPIAIKPGKYLVQVSRLKSAPVSIELTGNQLLELKLDEQGQLAPTEPENK